MYTEDHCALRWLVVVNGILWLTLCVLFLILPFLTNNPVFFLFLFVTLMLFFFTTGTTGLVATWPIGIRLTCSGVRIGGVRRAARRQARDGGDPRKPPRARAQRGEVFFCPWQGVQRAEVVTDEAELRKLKRHRAIDTADARGRRVPVLALGRLWAPHMKAALVLTVDLSVASVPEFRPPDARRYWFKFSDFTPFRPSPVWFAPTRHPEALREALARFNVPGPATSRPGSPGPW